MAWIISIAELANDEHEELLARIDTAVFAANELDDENDKLGEEIARLEEKIKQLEDTEQ